MAFCTKCGKQSVEGTRFCTGCGAELGSAPPPAEDTRVMPPVPPQAPPPAAQAPVPQGYPAPTPAPARKRSGGVVVAIVAAVLVVLLLCCGVGGFFGWKYFKGLKGTASADGPTTSTGGDGESGESGGDSDAAGDTDAGDTDAGASSDGPPSSPAGDISTVGQLSASTLLSGYSVDNLLDGDSTTCWAEGVGGYGVGHMVTFTFPREVWVQSVRVIPGYDKYDSARGVDRWWSNGRVKGARLHFSDGSMSRVFILSEDDRGMQDMVLPEPVKTTTVAFEIVSVYPASTGTRHDAQDTSISEMRVEGWAE